MAAIKIRRVAIATVFNLFLAYRPSKIAGRARIFCGLKGIVVYFSFKVHWPRRF
jgi:hypothetical protein